MSTSSTGDEFTIRIGGNASGPVVAGHGNHIEAHPPEPRPAPSAQTNTAEDHGTVYAVTNGDMHVHHGTTS